MLLGINIFWAFLRSQKLVSEFLTVILAFIVCFQLFHLLLNFRVNVFDFNITNEVFSISGREGLGSKVGEISAVVVFAHAL